MESTANVSEHSFSLEFTLCSRLAHCTQLTFYLRHLEQHPQEVCIEQAKSIMDEVANELYTLTGLNISKGNLKVGDTVVQEVVYEDLEPVHYDTRITWALNIQFTQDQGFVLPVSAAMYGCLANYNPKSPEMGNFLSRFQEDGQLSLAAGLAFYPEDTPVVINGRPWGDSESNIPEEAPKYVYVIRMGDTNIYRIAKSWNPQGVLVEIQEGSPYPLELLYTFVADNAIAAERMLQRLLREQHIWGAWFELTPAQSEALLTIDAFARGKFVVAGRSVYVNELFKLK
ncbi:MAG: GIY-YIG nuclease family protein [Anaerolineae bacterium]|nr:GIY-YIG nuclease family protein [Anaerolineae bacterium]